MHKKKRRKRCLRGLLSRVGIILDGIERVKWRHTCVLVTQWKKTAPNEDTEELAVCEEPRNRHRAFITARKHSVDKFKYLFDKEMRGKLTGQALKEPERPRPRKSEAFERMGDNRFREEGK